MRKFINIKSVHGVETIDEIISTEFNSTKEYRQEVKSVLENTRLLFRGMNISVYTSTRCTRDWREKS